MKCIVSFTWFCACCESVMTEFSLEKLLSNKKNLERILDNLKEGIIAHDVNRRIFFFNPPNCFTMDWDAYTLSILAANAPQRYGGP